MDARAAL
jgi:hypothetical protein